MREAVFWWHEAVQLADDELSGARVELQAWDPAAPFDAREAQRRFLAADHGGYVKRTLAAVQRATRLARTPAERVRAEEKQREWEAAAHRTGQGAGIIRINMVTGTENRCVVHHCC